MSITVGPKGVLYVTTTTETEHRGGTLFSLTPPRAAGEPWAEEILFDFHYDTGHKAPDGKMPNGVVVDEKTGKIFGTTFSGGSGRSGTIFSLSPPASSGGKWTFKRIHQFGPMGGENPSGTLLKANGVMYGVTEGGGIDADEDGTVFSIVP